MELKKVNVMIEDFEDKKAQSGKRYTRFKTSDGWMSAFDKDIIDQLKDHEGKDVCISVATDNEKGFKNIRSFNGEADESVKAEEIKPSGFGAKSVAPKNATTMYVSYAKDIFCHLQQGSNENAEENMKTAINLVNQAKSVFE